jgi:hypothetical protein
MGSDGIEVVLDELYFIGCPDAAVAKMNSVVLVLMAAGCIMILMHERPR